MVDIDKVLGRKREEKEKEKTVEFDEKVSCDVLVVGGGLAAICAAIQAGRMGCDVILIEKDQVLGGNSGPMLGVHPSGAHSFHPYASETGIIGEIEEDAAWLSCKIHTLGYHYNIAQQWDSLLHRKLIEAGVRVWRCNMGKDVIMDGLKIQSVIVEDLATYRTKRVRIGVAVIDGSGDGQIAFKAKANYRVGREAKKEYDERCAPNQGDRWTMGASVTALVRKTSKPVPFVPPPGTPPYEIGYGFGKGELRDCLNAHSYWRPDADFCFLWHTETGGQQDVILHAHEIYEELIRQLYSVWNHIKNEAHAEEAKNWELVWVSPKVGKRESRRFVGDVTLTQGDIEEAREFDDAVGYGGYAIDVHNPAGRRLNQATVVFYSVPPLWSVPYRMLYSENIRNLFFAGRLASASHIALGSWRLQKTLATGGQAVGMAVALCKKYDCQPRAIYEEHIEELQQLLLKADATILTVPNKDEKDLARKARVSATSEEVFEAAEISDFEPLDQFRGVMLWDWPEEIQTIEVYLKNENDQPKKIEFALHHFVVERKWKEIRECVGFPYWKHRNRMEWGDKRSVARFRPIKEVQIEAPAGFESWIQVPLEAKELGRKDPTSDEERYAFVATPVSGVSWAVQKRYVDFARRIWAKGTDPEYQEAPESHAFRITPRPRYGEAVNVINGWSRRFCTNPVNMWISRHDDPMPQALTLEWDEPQTFNTVHLVFDTFTRTFLEMPFNADKRVSPMLVRSYTLEAEINGQWEEIVHEQNNHNRRRVHVFDTIQSPRLRLTIHSIWDKQYTARLYEIRVYNEEVQAK